jgi:hypothetical protein
MEYARSDLRLIEMSAPRGGRENKVSEFFRRAV